MQRVDLLRYQIEEINRAGLQPGEEDELAAERARLANADRLATTPRRRTRRSPGATTSTSAVARFRPCGNQLRLFESISAIDPTTKGISERVDRASLPRRRPRSGRQNIS